MTYNIFEAANSYGSNVSYVKSRLEGFESLKGDFGIKFQPLVNLLSISIT